MDIFRRGSDHKTLVGMDRVLLEFKEMVGAKENQDIVEQNNILEDWAYHESINILE